MDADYRKIPMNLMSIHGLWCTLYFLTESATKHINEINGRLSPEIPESAICIRARRWRAPASSSARGQSPRRQSLQSACTGMLRRPYDLSHGGGHLRHPPR